ncbi:MAG: DUF1573 domain-containing protein [Cyclobacteriaceae bacterium]|nr:DUF1573 domain-containing protein [Cyclobacteriaceae bacterium]UYN87853.1 MAG: DUF1573 domain-containing protein [Cyclobacteriaceae bacterium]
MKKFFVFLLMVALASGTYAQDKQATTSKTNGPVLTFEKNTHDFGDIFQGDQVEHVFKFTNTGNEPLIISNIQVTCGCTAPSWPKNPIPPGGKGEIKIGFNSTGKMGRQNKTVTVVSNAVNDDNLISFVTNILAKNPN